MFEAILIGAFGLGALAFVWVIALGVVRRMHGRDNGEWEDAPAAGDPPKARPGPGWGNGGSWN
jgi:hypothetical protein